MGRNRLSEDQRMDRFRSRLLEGIQRADGCWEWTKFRIPQGYGMLGGPGSRPVYAHRAAYEMFVGEIPPGLEVRHRCDNRACCNPDHLTTGTHAENMRDKCIPVEQRLAQ